MFADIISKFWIFLSINQDSSFSLEQFGDAIEWEKRTSSYTKLLRNDLEKINSQQKEHHKAKI